MASYRAARTDGLSCRYVAGKSGFDRPRSFPAVIGGIARIQVTRNRLVVDGSKLPDKNDRSTAKRRGCSSSSIATFAASRLMLRAGVLSVTAGTQLVSSLVQNVVSETCAFSACSMGSRAVKMTFLSRSIVELRSRCHRSLGRLRCMCHGGKSS